MKLVGKILVPFLKHGLYIKNSTAFGQIFSAPFSNTLSLCLMKPVGKILVPFLKHGLNIKNSTAFGQIFSAPCFQTPSVYV
jgi:hypothetical protein